MLLKQQVDYRLELFRDMMRSVGRLVALPDAEFVAHLWDHPKVARQQPLPIFAHYADAAHRDVPMPAPWSWDEKSHRFPQPFTKVACRVPHTPAMPRDPLAATRESRAAPRPAASAASPQPLRHVSYR